MALPARLLVLAAANGAVAVAIAHRYATLQHAEAVHALAMGQAPDELGAAPAPPSAPAHTPETHLPLRGMEGYAGSDDDACLRMEGFLTAATEVLSQHGPMELAPHEVPGRIEGTSCSIDDPALAPLLDELSEAWRAAGLSPVGPLQ